MAKRETVEKKHSNAVLNIIATETDTVEVQIQDQDQVFCQRAMIDTRSDWDCLGINQLASLGRTTKLNLCVLLIGRCKTLVLLTGES